MTDGNQERNEEVVNGEQAPIDEQSDSSINFQRRDVLKGIAGVPVVAGESHLLNGDAAVAAQESSDSDPELVQSFEGSSVGDQAPEDPWYTFNDGGLQEVVDSPASEGDNAFRTANAPLGDASAIGIDLDLTNYTKITLDVFTLNNNPNWGNIKISLDGAGYGNQQTNIWDLPQTLGSRGYSNYRNVDQWYYDLEVDLSDYDGEHTVIFWVDGDNDAVWDNIRFFSSTGSSKTIVNSSANGGAADIGSQGTWKGEPMNMIDEDPSTQWQVSGNPDEIFAIFELPKQAEVTGDYLQIGTGGERDVTEYELYARDSESDPWELKNTFNGSVTGDGTPDVSRTFDPNSGLQFKLVITEHRAPDLCYDSCDVPIREYQLLGEYTSDDSEPNQPPTADFTYSPDSPKVSGEEVTFDASESTDSDGSIAQYEWDFNGDGTTDATGKSVTHTFSDYGEYSVTLSVTDSDGKSAQISKNISAIVNLQPYIDEKQDKIDSIQGSVAGPLDSDTAENQVDQEAQSLLNQIDSERSSASNTERRQFQEVLERMNSTEEVTKAATRTVADDNSPTATVIRDIFSFVTTVAMEEITEFAGGIIKKVTKSIADGVISKFDDLANAFKGKGVVPESTLSSIDGLLNDLKSNQFGILKQYMENNPEQATSIAEAASSEGISGVENEGKEVLNQLEGNRDVEQELEKIYFEGYYFNDDWDEVNIPTPEEIEIPDIDYTYDVPDENLPIALRTLVPDKIDIDIDTADIELPDVPLLSDAADILEELGDISTVNGIDTTVGERMDYLENNITSLRQQDGEIRQTTTDTLSGGISDIGMLVVEYIEGLESFQEWIDVFNGTLGKAIVVSALIAAALFVTGLGPITLLGVTTPLATISTLLTAQSLMIDLVQLGIGQGYLSFVNTLHHIGTFGLAETDLGSGDLGNGNEPVTSIGGADI